MDRLHTVILLAVAVAGCEKSGGGGGGGEPAAEAGGRVNAVETVKKRPVTVAELCDVHHAAASAPAMTWPPLQAGQTAPAKGTWRWLNVWATWCHPCIEEMPLLSTWQKSLGAEGVKYDLVFLSVDATEQLVADFRAKHPSTPASLRMDSPESLPAWQTAIGAEGAPIPIHVFLDPDDKIRCVRAGGMKETDLPAVRSVLQGS